MAAARGEERLQVGRQGASTSSWGGVGCGDGLGEGEGVNLLDDQRARQSIQAGVAACTVLPGYWLAACQAHSSLAKEIQRA